MTQFIKLLSLILFFTGSNTLAQSNDVIDNQKLIQLTNQKIGDDLIISFIKSSQTNFNCGMTAILALKKENVSENVLVEVMKICNSAKTVQEEVDNINNPSFKHPSGVYVYTEAQEGVLLKKLFATVISNEKGGGMGNQLASRFTFGTAKSSTIVQINGQVANMKTKSGNAFYFYFENTDKPGMANWWFIKATSPNEFTLIKLKQKRNNREFSKGKSDSYSYQTGIDDEQKIQFDFEEVKPGIFKVTSKTALKEGEYCFIYSAAVPSQYSNDKVFDFSVTK